MERTQDEGAAVRQAACLILGFAPTRSTAASDALATSLSDDEEKVRVTAAAQLALRDDPRGDDVLGALDHTDEHSPYRWLLYDVSCHRWRTSNSSAAEK
ncbi:HEAT repeat domain-containing protein [Actinomadura coerulea]|uniref:HEAT repeat domain-containing protein n=1 Tax=Actinomadura coerulea TaxID=46159 RepID=UPI003F4D96F5